VFSEDPVPALKSDAAWILRMDNGDIYRGEFASLPSQEGFGWHSPSFLRPLRFPWNSIHGIEKYRHSNMPPNDSADDGDRLFTVEQHSGISVSGEIVAIDAAQIHMRIDGLGVHTIPTSDVKNILRIYSAAREQDQVMQAENWEQVLPAPKNGKATKWFLKAGEISTDTSGTTISQWATLPPLATMDIEVAWEQPTVNWWLTIGEPRRMELQVRKLQNKNLLNVTLLVENSRDADVASVQIPFPKEPHIRLRLLCDADKGTYVLMMDDRVLGRIKGNLAEKIVGRNKFSFTNTALGILTLRDLRISNRPFVIPEESVDLAVDVAEVMTRQRGTFVGRIEDAADPSEVLLRGANGTNTTISWDEIERMEFPKRSDASQTNARPDLYRVDLANGLRFTAEKLLALASDPDRTDQEDAESNALCLEYTFGSVCIPWQKIDRISRVRIAPTSPATTPSDANRSMRLVTQEVVSTGRVHSVFQSETGTRTLMWLPVNSETATPIHSGVDGAIEPLASAPLDSDLKGVRTPSKAVVRADTPNPDPPPSRDLHPDEPSLFLINGDCFPGKVMAGTEQQVKFQSSWFERTSVPADQVRGARIVDYQGADAIDRATRARILTLPRVQRRNPPTHLVVARDGDLVRGRLISFDRDEIHMEIRGEERTLAMKNVAEIIWLEAAPSIATETDERSTDESNQTSSMQEGIYQVLLEQGARISISPESVTDEELNGVHPLLGECSIPWDKVTRLMLGNTIRSDASKSRFGKWKLLNAPDPKFVNEGSTEQNDAPVDTAQDRLIGKPAPDQELLKLDGTPFRMDDYRGKVLILDFWASWCGPCLKSMPRIHQIAREHTDAGVDAVFVNLEESEDRVRGLLERLEVVPQVAMDTDGSFAKQYAVQAIPQTVVIDRDGTIVRVLVGAGEQTEQELIRILSDLTKN
jgi:thiol-disulfide isomerase/thioredoxin